MGAGVDVWSLCREFGAVSGWTIIHYLICRLFVSSCGSFVFVPVSLSGGSATHWVGQILPEQRSKQHAVRVVQQGRVQQPV